MVYVSGVLLCLFLVDLEMKEQELEQLKLDREHFKARLETLQADCGREKKVGDQDRLFSRVRKASLVSCPSPISSGSSYISPLILKRW